MQLLETLRLVEGFDMAALQYQGAEHLHLLIQAIKIARNDKNKYAHSEEMHLDELLAEPSIASRRKTLDLHHATPSLGERPHAAAQPRLSAAGHTTHLVTADAAGNMVSLTQTLGHLFGAVVSIGDLGVTLNDMAFWFDLEPSSPNVIAPRKRQTSPISPVIVDDEGGRRTAIGTPGGFGIPQTTAQMITGLIDFRLSPQAVVEAPRFRVDEGVSVSIETRVPPAVVEALRGLGHDIVEVGPWLWDVQPSRGDLGRASIVQFDSQSRALFAAADPRGDGLAVAW
jgi:gamma-glutamyltranspeptidase/glutathione hydrolase